MISERDQRNIVSTARDEGRAEGQQQERLAIAGNLKEIGMSDDVIMNLTGLSAEDLAKL